jgi:serine/threonine protein kinase
MQDAWAASFHPSKAEVCFDRPEDELETYRKIAEAELAPDLRICRLRGIVQDEEGFSFGMLLTYIGHRQKTLHEAIWPDTPISLKEQWASQISESLAALHGSGIVWGDAKAENVLIDGDNNAWITDFGGSYTEGWVDMEKAGTVEVDLQGLAKILDYIRREDNDDDDVSSI